MNLYIKTKGNTYEEFVYNNLLSSYDKIYYFLMILYKQIFRSFIAIKNGKERG